MNAKTKLAAIALGLMAALANVIHAGLVVFIVSIVFSRCIVAQSGISGAMNHRGDRSNVVFLPLPVDISNYDAQHPDAEVKNRLYHYALNWLRSEELAAAAESPVDLVIVFTDPKASQSFQIWTQRGAASNNLKRAYVRQLTS